MNQRIQRRGAVSGLAITFACLASSIAVLAPSGFCGEELQNPFVCLERTQGDAFQPRPIVLVSAHLYRQADLIEDRLRAVGAAAPGGPDDVDLLLSGLVFGHERSLTYKEWRLGAALHGRVSGLEDEDAYALAGLMNALFALSDSHKRIGDFTELERVSPQGPGIKRYVLRELHLLSLVAEAWRATSRPITCPPGKVDAGHMAEIEHLFDLIVNAASGTGAALPAPDAPGFDELVLGPRQEAVDDDLAFVWVLRELVRQLARQSATRPSPSAAVAPAYRPDWRDVHVAVRDQVFMINDKRSALLDEIVYRRRHYAALSNLAEVYCRPGAQRPVELILSCTEVERMRELLESLVGPDVPIQVRDIAD